MADVDGLLLSYEALKLMLKLRAKQSISWVLAKRNWNGITNTLLQNSFIKPYGPPHKAIIYPTKRGQRVINTLIPKAIANEYEKLSKRHFWVAIACLIWLVIGFIILGFHRWYLWRTAPVSFVMVLGVEALITYWFTPLDFRIVEIEQSIRYKYSEKYLKNLFKRNHLKWNKNVDTYFLTDKF